MLISRKSKESNNRKKHKAKKKVHPFRLSATSGQLLPLQTIRQRLVGIWQSLNWPVCVKILKSNIAVTIALGLLLLDPIRKYSSTGGILASVAVEFVHPSKSYGFLAEDVLLGTIMCCISASWSILGIFLASLLRDPNSTVLAQPEVCAILALFMVFGCFALSMFRVKVEQANVGGMLSATIMVISLSTAVTNTEFSAIPTLQVLIPTLVGFFLNFAIFFFLFPENSTRVYIQQLIKLFETFDKITQRQVDLFVGGKNASLESTASTHQQVDTLITTLIQKKRMVRREPSYNVIAPTDVSELTSLVKKLRVPIQGLSLSRAMEENMRKAEKTMFTNYEEIGSEDTTVSPSSNILAEEGTRSYYGDTDEEENWTITDSDEDDNSRPSTPKSPLSTANTSVSSLVDSSNHNDCMPRPRKRKIRWEDPMKVITCWRADYDDVLRIVKPTYLELTNACSLAVQETIKRLRKMQNLDARFQDRPFFYKYYYRWKVGSEQDKEEKKAFAYSSKEDPSICLFQAIQKFQEHRLVGLNKLYTKSGVPRRILFLLLMFQFNLHAYAEIIYTVSSLVYELDQNRFKSRFWLPHISLSKWIFQRRRKTDDCFELDTPAAIVETSNPLSLQKTLSRGATLLAQKKEQAATVMDLEAQRVLYRLNTPHRGQIRPRRSKKIPIDLSRKNYLDPLDYHDPDVAYPTSSTERFFYSIYVFMVKKLYTADVAFSFRAAVIVAFLSLPGFLESSVRWYNQVRGQWAVVVALIWMGPSVGSSFFGTMTRSVGTFIGAIESIIIWEMSKGSVPGLIVLSFLFNLPWWLVYINGKFWRATGLFSLITLSLIIGYTYSFQPKGHPVSVYEITWERSVGVIVGVLAAMIASIFPFPRTSRVVLRHRISQTLDEIGALYSSFLGIVLKNERGGQLVNKTNRKLFHVVAECIRQQIKGERVLLEQSRFEPALRGIFPEDKYLHILQILENILSLMLEMVFAFDKITPRWRIMILKDTWKERKIQIAAILTALHLGSSALTTKTPLPPYVMRPTKARRNLTNLVRKSSALKVEHLGERDYTYFSAYLMSSEQLAVEIEILITIIRDLVGPDSVSIWLNYKH